MPPTASPPQPPSIVARVGGVIGPFLLVGAAGLALSVSFDAGGSALTLVPASLFFGLWAFDVLVAAGMAVSRLRRTGSGHYSAMPMLPGIFLVLWLLALGAIPDAGGPQRWIDRGAMVLVVGVVCIGAEITIVRALDRIR